MDGRVAVLRARDLGGDAVHLCDVSKTTSHAPLCSPWTHGADVWIWMLPHRYLVFDLGQHGRYPSWVADITLRGGNRNSSSRSSAGSPDPILLLPPGGTVALTMLLKVHTQLDGLGSPEVPSDVPVQGILESPAVQSLQRWEGQSASLALSDTVCAE